MNRFSKFLFFPNFRSKLVFLQFLISIGWSAFILMQPNDGALGKEILWALILFLAMPTFLSFAIAVMIVQVPQKTNEVRFLCSPSFFYGLIMGFVLLPILAGIFFTVTYWFFSIFSISLSDKTGNMIYFVISMQSLLFPTVYKLNSLFLRKIIS